MIEEQIKLLLWSCSRAPLHHVGNSCCWHSGEQLGSGADGDGTFTGEELPAPSFEAVKHTNVGERILDGAGYGGLCGFVGLRQPLLQDSARLKSLLGDGVKVLRIEQARTGGLDRRRGSMMMASYLAGERSK